MPTPLPSTLAIHWVCTTIEAALKIFTFKHVFGIKKNIPSKTFLYFFWVGGERVNILANESVILII